MKSMKVGVLYGGKSQERQGSLKTGKVVIDALRRKKYEVYQIDPKQNNFIEKLKYIDVVFMALHGWYGEDGKIQGMLECLDVPYTGCGVLASSIGMNKVLFKKVLIAEGIPTPKFVLLSDSNIDCDTNKVIKNLGNPIVLKPISGGGSLGIFIGSELEKLNQAIVLNKKQSFESFAEKYIDGVFLTVGVLGKYRNPKVLPVMEIKYKGVFYDYHLKHTCGASEYIVPANIPSKFYDKAQEYAHKIYLSIGCIGAVRIDMIYSTNEDSLYVLEINTAPGLSKIGNFPAIACAANIEYDDLIEQILLSAFDRPKYVS